MQASWGAGPLDKYLLKPDRDYEYGFTLVSVIEGGMIEFIDNSKSL